MTTLNETRKIMHAVVAEFGPDHKQRACVNATDDGQPVCIAAQVIHRVIPPQAWQLIVDDEDAQEGSVINVRTALRDNNEPWPFDVPATEYLMVAQQMADTAILNTNERNTWGTALEEAENWARMTYA